MKPSSSITDVTVGLEGHKMLVRILSAVFLLPLLLFVLLVLPPLYTALLVAVLSSVAAYELLWGTGLLKKLRPVIYSAVMAFLVVLWSYLGEESSWLVPGVFAFMILLLAEVMADHEQITFQKICVCLAAGLVIPYMFSALVRLRGGNGGKILVLVPFLISFVSDSGAYFVGVFFGKHKLAPKISPKKTVEGLLGGIGAAMLGMVVFCLVLKRFFNFSVNYFSAAVFGAVGALICVFGDLSFSVIKRQTGIKDYSRLIPGHGGVLDRFDSTIFVAPMVEIFMALWPAMVSML